MWEFSFDPLAVAVDWLDACKARDPDILLDLYDPIGTHQCSCEGGHLHEGRTALAQYWLSRLARAVPHAFELFDLALTKTGVVLDHSAFDGALVRITFAFTDAGRIRQSVCGLVRACPRAAQPFELLGSLRRG
jgi:hypothetical protein